MPESNSLRIPVDVLDKPESIPDSQVVSGVFLDPGGRVGARESRRGGGGYAGDGMHGCRRGGNGEGVVLRERGYRGGGGQIVAGALLSPLVSSSIRRLLSHQ